MWIGHNCWIKFCHLFITGGINSDKLLGFVCFIFNYLNLLDFLSPSLVLSHNFSYNSNVYLISIPKLKCFQSPS